MSIRSFTSILVAVLFLAFTSSAQKPDDCACETAPLPDVLAIVNGMKLRAADVFDIGLQSQITGLQRSVIDERKNALQGLVNLKLVEAEARKRGMSLTRLLKEVTSKVADPTDTEIQEFYNGNRESINLEFAEKLAMRDVYISEIRSDIIQTIRNRREAAEIGKFADKLRAATEVKMLVDTATPPATAADRSRVFATINSVKITSGDVEDTLRPTIFMVQERVYRLRRDKLELSINDILLKAEARRRGTDLNQLFEVELWSKVQPVTEADAREFYNNNKTRINGDFETVKDRIIGDLRSVKMGELERQLVGKLRRAASIQTFLPEPVPPVYAIDTAGRPSKGPQNAPVTIVVFMDVECRTCSELYHVLDRLFNEMNGKIRLVVMHFPLTEHTHAQKAAEAAREQGSFWEYIDLLFKNQNDLEIGDLKQYASQLGLDRKKFDAVLDGTRLMDNVYHDQLEGEKIGVNRIPTVFINGRQYIDATATLERLKTAVETALKAR